MTYCCREHRVAHWKAPPKGRSWGGGSSSSAATEGCTGFLCKGCKCSTYSSFLPVAAAGHGLAHAAVGPLASPLPREHAQQWRRQGRLLAVHIWMHPCSLYSTHLLDTRLISVPLCCLHNPVQATVVAATAAGTNAAQRQRGGRWPPLCADTSVSKSAAAASAAAGLQWCAGSAMLPTWAQLFAGRAYYGVPGAVSHTAPGLVQHALAGLLQVPSPPPPICSARLLPVGALALGGNASMAVSMHAHMYVY